MQHDRTALADIHECNLALLMLARKVATTGTAQEKAVLGMDTSSCQKVAQITDEQMMRLARSSMVLGRFALTDHVLLASLDTGRESGTLRLAQAALKEAALSTK